MAITWEMSDEWKKNYCVIALSIAISDTPDWETVQMLHAFRNGSTIDPKLAPIWIIEFLTRPDIITILEKIIPREEGDTPYAELIENPFTPIMEEERFQRLWIVLAILIDRIIPKALNTKTSREHIKWNELPEGTSLQESIMQNQHL